MEVSKLKKILYNFFFRLSSSANKNDDDDAVSGNGKDSHSYESKENIEKRKRRHHSSDKHCHRQKSKKKHKHRSEHKKKKRRNRRKSATSSSESDSDWYRYSTVVFKLEKKAFTLGPWSPAPNHHTRVTQDLYLPSLLKVFLNKTIKFIPCTSLWKTRTVKCNTEHLKIC